MFSTLKHGLLAIVVACVAVVSISSPVLAKSRIVTYPQSAFSYDGYGGHYEGTCTIKYINGLLKYNCEGQIVSGDKVAKRTDISSGGLRGFLTPRGEVVEKFNGRH